VEIGTTQLPELQGASISDDTYRTDLAEAAVDALDAAGLDVDGSSYERRSIELRPGGE
nr:hypothetical protein [Acidobacteriota bacterium]